jgi:hypothetical protein
MPSGIIQSWKIAAGNPPLQPSRMGLQSMIICSEVFTMPIQLFVL